MARRPRGRAFVGRKRQRVEWSGGFASDLVQVNADSLSAITSSLGLQNALDSMTSPTLVRVRGEILVMASGGTLNDDVLVGVGKAVVSRRAALIGTTAMPRPITDLNYSWLWHGFAMLRLLALSSEGFNKMSAVRFVVDSRAMRKILSDEEELVTCLETRNASGSAGVIWSPNERVLLKES